MKTIGTLLKSQRESQNITLSSLEKTTKIRSSFINSIEKEDWENLPNFPIILGFVKSIATALSMDEHLATATLKRDYPPKKVRIAPKPDIKSKFFWSPKLTFFAGILLCLVIFFGYLGYAYYKFSAPPTLNLTSPVEGQIVKGGKVTVFGISDNDVSLVINNQPVLVGDDGKFTIELLVSENTQEIVAVGISRSGKESVVHRKIVVQ